MKETSKNTITPTVIKNAIDFEESLRHMEALVRNNQHSISKETDDYSQLIKLNFQRMKRVYKTTHIHDKLEKTTISFPTHLIWIVLTNPKCGDSAQSIPVIQRIADLNNKIRLKILYSNDHPKILDAYLTNGSRSIPKLICLEAKTLKELGTWGPRPRLLQNLLIEHNNNPVLSKSEFSEMIQRKYIEDKTKSIQKEFLGLLESWSIPTL